MEPKKTGYWRSLYQSLASLRLTVVIFLVLATASVFGTLLPQGQTPVELERLYGAGTSRVLEFLGVNDLYRTGWFRFLLLLLCVNLIVCTFERLPKTLKRVRHHEDQINPEKLLKFTCSREMTTRLPFDEMQARLDQVITRHFAPPVLVESANAHAATAERARWSSFMVYIVHLSVLVVLVGALLGSIFGFKGMMSLAEGEISSEVVLTGERHRTVSLPFQVRCDQFHVSFYDTGAPSEFRSDLVIVENGKEVRRESIRVNDPLTHRGVTFYQSSYGTTLRQAEIQLTDRETGKLLELTVAMGEPAVIPGTRDRLEIVNYQQDLSHFGPAVALVLFREGHQEPIGTWVLARVPEFHGNRLLNYQIRITDMQTVQYTGLQVKQDPGVWVVWLGFTAMLVGIGLTFYTSHRRLWIHSSKPSCDREPIRVVVAGRASKNFLAFEHEFNELLEQIESALKPDPEQRRESKA